VRSHANSLVRGHLHPLEPLELPEPIRIAGVGNAATTALILGLGSEGRVLGLGWSAYVGGERDEDGRYGRVAADRWREQGKAVR
jgi:hypothetical protein